MVAFLDKPTESDRFEQIVDFLNAHPIKYALMVNPTIYTSCIEQFLTTTKVKTVNGEVHIQALVDTKKVIITKTSIESDLQLEQLKIFKQLTLMGAKTTASNAFSSTMASAVICLATNQKFNFSKYIFDNMVKNLEGGVKFLMYLRFVQVFLDKQVEGMSKHKKIYVTPSHIKKIFANMKREGKGFSRTITPLFPTMIVQAQEQVGEEPVTNDTKNVASVPTHSNDPLLNEKVKKLERKEGQELTSSEDYTRLVDLQEWFPLKTKVWVIRRMHPNKGGKLMKLIDQDAEVTLVDEIKLKGGLLIPVTTVGEVVTTTNVVVSTAKVTTDNTTTTTVDELTLAQTLIEIKATKPKARGVIVQEPSEFTTTTSPSQPS
ncbi:hypothetical protein Tco_0280961 [Tanacetum coccineum]